MGSAEFYTGRLNCITGRPHKCTKGNLKVKKVKSGDIALCGKPISEIRSVTYCMGSHSVTCHPTQMNAPCLNPSQVGRYSIYLPRRDGRLSCPRRLVHTKMVYLHASSHPSKY